MIRNGQAFYFTPTDLMVFDPVVGVPVSLANGLTAFYALAVGPGPALFAAAKTELAVFDPVTGAKSASVSLVNASSLTVSPSGATYLVRDGTVWCFVMRLGNLVPAWRRDLTGPLISQVSLSADGATAYASSSQSIYAMNAADGSPLWRRNLPNAARHLTAPVAGLGNGLSYFGVDDTLYVFARNQTPVASFQTVPGETVWQPAITADNRLIWVQGGCLYTLGAEGTGPPAVVKLDGLVSSKPVTTVLDGAGNIFLLDGANQFFALNGSGAVCNVPTKIGIGQRLDGLQIAPDGTIWCASVSALWQFTPMLAAAEVYSAYADTTSYRAASDLCLAGGTVPGGASVVFAGKQSISVKPGFAVPAGTAAAFRTGA